MGELGSGSGTSYPGGLDTDNVLEVNSPNAGKTKARAEVPNDMGAAIVAIQTELGTDPAGSLTDVKTFLQTEHGADGTHSVDVAFVMTDQTNANHLHDKTTGGGLIREVSRSLFAWASTTAITLGVAGYRHIGTTSQVVFWDSNIAFTLGSGGSNAGSTDLGNNENHYIYIDDSAVVTLDDNELTASEFINVTTAPTYSAAKRGYYNGSDRCIFAIRTDGSAQVNVFFHDGGDFLSFDAFVLDRADTDLDDTFTDVTLTVPGFSTRALCRFVLSWVNVTVNLSYRANGSSGVGAVVGGAVDTNTRRSSEIRSVMTDSAQKIEVALSAAGDDTVSVQTHGWFFPRGM